MKDNLLSIFPIIAVAIILLGAVAYIADDVKFKFKLHRITQLFGSGANIKSRVEQVQQELMPKPSDKE